MNDFQIESGESGALAEACLAYLISDPEELGRFMTHAGLDSDALRQAVGSKSFALGMFDYFAQNESALLAMCANSGISAERFMRAWHRLNPDY